MPTATDYTTPGPPERVRALRVGSDNALRDGTDRPRQRQLARSSRTSPAASTLSETSDPRCHRVDGRAHRHRPAWCPRRVVLRHLRLLCRAVRNRTRRGRAPPADREEIMADQLHGEALRSMAYPGTANDDVVLGKDPQPDRRRGRPGRRSAPEQRYPEPSLLPAAMELGTMNAAKIRRARSRTFWSNSSVTDQHTSAARRRASGARQCGPWQPPQVVRAASRGRSRVVREPATKHPHQEQADRGPLAAALTSYVALVALPGDERGPCRWTDLLKRASHDQPWSRSTISGDRRCERRWPSGNGPTLVFTSRLRISCDGTRIMCETSSKRWWGHQHDPCVSGTRGHWWFRRTRGTRRLVRRSR